MAHDFELNQKYFHNLYYRILLFYCVVLVNYWYLFNAISRHGIYLPNGSKNLRT